MKEISQGGKSLTVACFACHSSCCFRSCTVYTIGILGNNSEFIHLTLTKSSNPEGILCDVGVIALEPTTFTSGGVWLTLNNVACDWTSTIVQWCRPFQSYR